MKIVAPEVPTNVPKFAGVQADCPVRKLYDPAGQVMQSAEVFAPESGL